MTKTKLANELLRIAKLLISNGSVLVSPKIKKKIDSLLQESLDDSLLQIQQSERQKLDGFKLSEWLSKAESAIKEIREDLQNNIKKEAHQLLSDIDKAIRNDDLEKLKDLQDEVFKKFSWYVKNEVYGYGEEKHKATGYTMYRGILRKLDPLLESYIKTEKDIQDNMDNKKEYYKKREKEIFEEVDKFAKHLTVFAREVGWNLIVDSNIDNDDIFSEKIDLNFYVSIEGTDLGVSVFPNGGKNEVDDVIDDSDFFDKSGSGQVYDSLIHFLRTGQLPKDKPVKFIKLYRAMSTVEYQKWQHGQDIPEGKYFTSQATGDFAYDDSDLASKIENDPNFSYGLESFRVRSDCVSQRDSSIYITIKPCKLDSGKIVPS